MNTLLSRLVLLLLFIGALGGVLYWQSTPRPEAPQEISITPPATNSFEATYINATPDLIVVTSPAPGDIISSPLKIQGTARGPWYFEASAPITLVNWDGLIVAEGIITAQDEWMIEEMVPFEGTLTFVVEDPNLSSTFLYPNATLILKNDNPSGEPAFDRAVEIPLLFSLP